MPKEGSHYDLPIALGLLVAMGVLPPQELERFVVIGELSLDGGIDPVAGTLPAAIAANARGKGLICPHACGPEAAWAGMGEDNPGGVLAPRSIIALVNHFRGSQVLSEPEPMKAVEAAAVPDLRDIKGQETAKRALEVAAAHTARNARNLDGRLAGGRASPHRRLPPPALSRAASFGFHAGPHRRRPARQARRGLARPSRRAVPRRIAGVSAAGARQPAPAARNRRGGGRPCQCACHLSRPFSARCRDEPLPLRPCWRCGPRLPARAALRRGLSVEAFGPHARPHRHPYRGAARRPSRPPP